MKRVIVAAVFLSILTTTYLLSSVSCTPPPKPPKLAVSPLELNLQIARNIWDTERIVGTLGPADRASADLHVSNSGDGELTWSVQYDADWLSLRLKDRGFEPFVTAKCTSENSTITASVTSRLMSPGNYATICKFYDVNNPSNFQTVAVNLLITPPVMKTYIDPLKRFSFNYPQDWKFDGFKKILTRPGYYMETGTLTAPQNLPQIDCKIKENTNFSKPSDAKRYVAGWLDVLVTECDDVTLVEYSANVDGWDGRGTYYFKFKGQGFNPYWINTAYVKILPGYVYYIEYRNFGPSYRPDEDWMSRMENPTLLNLKPIIDSFVFN